jgi:hypothetical protein
MTSPIEGLKGWDDDDISDAFRRLHEEGFLTVESPIELVDEQMPAFGEMGIAFARLLTVRDGDSRRGTHLSVGVYLTAAVIWTQLELLRQTYGTEASVAAAEIQAYLKSVDPKTLSRLMREYVEGSVVDIDMETLEDEYPALYGLRELIKGEAYGPLSDDPDRGALIDAGCNLTLTALRQLDIEEGLRQLLSSKQE